MLRSHAFLAVFVLVSLLAASARAQTSPGSAAVEGLITAESLAGPISFLASDELEGRGVGSRGDALARRYLASQFQLFGLEAGVPAATPDGKPSYDQAVPILGITALPSAPLTIRSAAGDGSFQAPQDYVVMAGRPAPTTEWKDLDLVFVGYGIRAAEYAWDDFKDVDVRGKVLLVMNNDPESDPALFAGKTRLYYGRWTYKYEEAARRGAAGAIIIHTESSAGYPFQVIQAGQGTEHFHLPFEAGRPTIDLQAWCSEDVAHKLATAGGKDLDELRAAAQSKDFRPVDLGVKVTLGTTNTVREIRSGNVVARLPGRDPAKRDEAVVVTAHFDHLGIGPERQGDTIYNGALDNASGCSALLQLARAVSALGERPRRTIVFAAVTAEESGLLGSLYFSRNPTVPPKKIVANLNIDGLNMWGRTSDLGMIGHGKNSLTALASAIATRRGRTIVPDAETDKGLFYRSDHFNFARIGVPCAYFKAGNDFLERTEAKRKVKQAYTTRYYHTPQDQFDDRWNLDGAAEDVRFFLEVLVTIANADDAPTWTPGDEFEKLR